jgi:hypothetical protein
MTCRPGPEPDAVSGFVGIHVPGDDYMTWFLGSQCVERPCHRHGLQATFPFMINLIVRQMVGQPNPPIRVRSQDLGHKTRTGELMGALGDMQINLHNAAQWPPSGRGDA